MAKWKHSPELKEIAEQAQQAKIDGDKEKLKELKKQLKKTSEICGAVQGTGVNHRVCMRKPTADNGRCNVHGAKAGPRTEEGRKKAMANLSPQNRLVHGVYSKSFKDQLTKEEVEFYNNTIEWFFDNYEKDTDPINLSLLDRYIINFLKQARKDSIDFLSDSSAYNDVETKMVRFAETLGLNRKFKESKENKDNAGSSVDIAVLLSGDKEKEE
jgi:hypothetical protein